MSETIKNKFFSGLAWTFIQNVAVKVFSFVFTVILTRILSPNEYGLIGMLAIFIAVSEVFALSGFGDALIQKKDCNDDDFSTAFYFNVTISLSIYLLLFFLAPFIANFYHEPKLVTLTRVLSLNIVLGSFNFVQQSILSRAMNFKPLALISLVCTVISGLVGVSLAYFGFGVWALVAQTLSSNLVRVIVFPLCTKWHPNRPFNRESFHYLWNYGSKIIVTGLVSVTVQNLSSILIGRFYNKEQVGYFERSRSLATLPSDIIFCVLSSVSFPVLCEFQDDNKRWLNVYRKILFNTVLVVFPLIILLALLAKPIIIILFTEKWATCIPLFQALLLARMFMPIVATHTSLLRSVGDTTLYMKLFLLTGPLSLLAVIISIPFGVVAMARATLMGSFLGYLIPAFVIGRKFGYPLHKQLYDWRHILLSLLIMGTCVLTVIHFITNLWVQLIIGGFVGLGVFLLCCWLFKLIDDDLINLLKSKLNNRWEA